MSRSYEEGFRDGKEEGFEEGKEEGFRDGKEEGVREGLEKGKKDDGTGGGCVVGFILAFVFIYFGWCTPW